jgi:hypothetical protein
VVALGDLACPQSDDKPSPSLDTLISSYNYRLRLILYIIIILAVVVIVPGVADVPYPKGSLQPTHPSFPLCRLRLQWDMGYLRSLLRRPRFMNTCYPAEVSLDVCCRSVWEQPSYIDSQRGHSPWVGAAAKKLSSLVSHRTTGLGLKALSRTGS